MTPKQLIINKICKKPAPGCGVCNPVSSATVGQMETMGAFFPEAHYDPLKMYELSRASYELLDYDGIMPVFSVVIESYAIGCKVDWGKSDTMPRITERLWKNYSDINIPDFISNHAVKAVLECITKLKNSYPDVAIIGKVFGPWTLSYHFFGVEEFLIKTVLDPGQVHSILGRLMEITVKFANAQVDAGADVITVADHATRDLCSPESYRDFLIPVHSAIKERIKTPVILHICGDTSDRIGYICRTGFDSFHFESKVDACRAVEIAGGRISLIGNINNPSTLLFKKPEDVRREVKNAIECGLDIIGPECAVPLFTPIENLREISIATKEFSERG